MEPQRYKRRDGSGCGYGCQGCLALVVLWLVGIVAIAFGGEIIDAAPTIIAVVAGLDALYGIYKIVFYFTHRKPISYGQAQAIANCRARKYAKKRYEFAPYHIAANPTFKSNLSTTGKWYSINEPLESFPSLAAALLLGKHHEWVIIALEKDGRVDRMWVNKGPDNSWVGIKCELADIVKMACEAGSYTVMRFHNHPNSEPGRYNALLPSDQDKYSAAYCSAYACEAGLNWLDFVCSRGEFARFHIAISDGFYLDGSRPEDIMQETGIDRYRDYELQWEYRKSRWRRFLKKY